MERYERKHSEYGSETVTTGIKSKPYYFVMGIKNYEKNGMTELEHDRLRAFVAVELASFLNRGRKPKWLKNAVREEENIIKLLDGLKIVSVGPLIDSNPPNIKLVVKPKTEKLRKELIDNLFKDEL